MIGSPGASAAAARPSLLVVDDEDAVCFALESYFGARGFTVDVASTLDEASALAARGGYVAVIADLRLGGSDGQEGLELLRRVRAANPTLPFVLVTGFGTGAVADEARALGVSALLTKPRPLAEIAQVVTSLAGAG